MGIERATFLIDETGVIRRIWRKVRVNGHVDAVLASRRVALIPVRPLSAGAAA